MRNQVRFSLINFMNQFDILKEILPEPKKKRHSRPSSLEVEIFKLPILATVDTLVEDRGFAFVLCASQTSKQFMHVTANVTRRRDTEREHRRAAKA